jgi:TonB family protein
MKKLILTIALLVYLAAPLVASKNPSAQRLLIAAQRQADLFNNRARSFQLEVDFLAQLNVPTLGHLTLKWESEDRWWSNAVMGGFEQTTVRAGDTLYIFRNADYTPLRVGELTALLQFATMHDSESATKIRHRVENGVAVDCVAVDREHVKEAAHEVCVDTTSHEISSEEWPRGVVNGISHEILRQEWHGAPDMRRRELFSDYFDFGDFRFPHKLQFQEDGINVVTANVSSLQTATFDENLLILPKGLIERRLCTAMKNAVPLKTPDPIYPQPSRKNRIIGDTTVAMTVLTDGSVSDIQLIGRATQALDDATLQTLKNWKFKPAMCGADPIVSDIAVIVSFRL